MDRKLFNRVVDQFVPHVPSSIGGRQAFVAGAAFGTEFVKILEYDGNARQFCRLMVNSAINYGKADGEFVLVALLRELKREVGEGKQRTIDGLIAEVNAALAPAAPPPEPEPTPPAPAKPAPKADAASTAGDLTRATLEILPPPFAWIAIPGGWVALEGRPEKFKVEPFYMAKYPVTTAQYAQFVNAGGYNDERWWPDGLWQIKNEKGWAQPRFWGDSKYARYNGPDQPVVGVSWYEALAFANWLDNMVGATHGSHLPGRVTLPTEMQWQRAAQGDDGREYPYGGTFDANRANTQESGIGATTPVTRYEGVGDSPYRVTDMSGNVWEWCLNTFEPPDNITVDAGDARRVLRGGSWDSFHLDARAASRNNLYPNLRNDYFGFRLVRAPSL